MLRLIAVLAVSLLAGGCSQPSPTLLDRVKSDLSKLPDRVMHVQYPDVSFYATLQAGISELTARDKRLAFGHFRHLLETPRLNDATLSDRQCSLEVYLDVVQRCTSIFAELSDKQEPAWEFLLLAFDVFDCEREKVGSPSYDPHIPAEGLHVDKPLYLSSLDRLRSKAFRGGFEHGAFGRFYWSLPPDRQREWLSWLDFVAHRKVDIPNPDNPRTKASDMFFRLPPQAPRCLIEKRQRMRNRHVDLRDSPEIPADADL